MTNRTEPMLLTPVWSDITAEKEQTTMTDSTYAEAATTTTVPAALNPDIRIETPRQRTMRAIAAIAAEHQVPLRCIVADDRHKTVVAARNDVIYWLAREKKWHLNRIADFLRKDHTAIRNALQHFADGLEIMRVNDLARKSELAREEAERKERWQERRQRPTKRQRLLALAGQRRDRGGKTIAELEAILRRRGVLL